ncbi:MAG: hypothetical protein ABJH04_11765, partial [Cyclobacteriaceae bacterium]
FDELQRKLQEESLACRTAEIGNLIRTIKRCLESKPYRESEEYLRKEISRTARNTDTHRSRLEKIREDCRSRVKGRFKAEIDKIDSGSRQVEREAEQLRQKHSSLEIRYHRKRIEIAEKDKELGLRIKAKIERSTGTRETFEERKRQIVRDRGKSIRDFESAKKELESDQEKTLRDIERERTRIEQIITSGEAISSKFEQLEREASNEFKELADSEAEEIERLERDSENEPRLLELSENRIREEFEELRSRSLDKIKRRNGDGNSELSRGITHLLQTRERLINFEKDNASYKRNREAWDSFNKGAYKNWTD